MTHILPSLIDIWRLFLAVRDDKPERTVVIGALTTMMSHSSTNWSPWSEKRLLDIWTHSNSIFFFHSSLSLTWNCLLQRNRASKQSGIWVSLKYIFFWVVCLFFLGVWTWKILSFSWFGLVFVHGYVEKWDLLMFNYCYSFGRVKFERMLRGSSLLSEEKWDLWSWFWSCIV